MNKWIRSLPGPSLFVWIQTEKLKQREGRHCKLKHPPPPTAYRLLFTRVPSFRVVFSAIIKIRHLTSPPSNFFIWSIVPIALGDLKYFYHKSKIFLLIGLNVTRRNWTCRYSIPSSTFPCLWVFYFHDRSSQNGNPQCRIYCNYLVPMVCTSTKEKCVSLLWPYERFSVFRSNIYTPFVLISCEHPRWTFTHQKGRKARKNCV